MSMIWECGNNFEKTKDIKSELVYGTLLQDADFTVAIPVYGVSQTLSDTLKNVAELRKNSLNVQIIISDNKPDDDIGKLIHLIENAKLENVALYTTNKSLGQYGNFNRCIELTRTNYLAMLHDDDLLVPNYYDLVERILPYLKEHPNIGLIQGKRINFITSPKLEETKKLRLYKVKRYYVTYVGYSAAEIPSCGMIFNKSAAILSGGFNDDYPASGDAFLATQMAVKGYSYYKSRDVFGYYRIGNNISITSKICKEFIVEDRKFEEDWAKTGLLENCYFKLFGRYFYSKNIDAKVLTFGKFNPELTIDNLDYLHIYKKYKKYGLTEMVHKVHGKVIACLIRLTGIRLL